MGSIEEKLFDLEEYLRRNDDSADSSAYLTIVGIANEVSELESENTKLRELVRDIYAVMVEDAANCDVTYPEQFDDRMRELGIEAGDG